MFSVVLNGILYLGISLEFRAELIDGIACLSIYNSGILWLTKEYSDLTTAQNKLNSIISVIETPLYHIDLDSIL